MTNNLETILHELNDHQKVIVRSRKNLVVTACPGSGKTRVLTYKLAFNAFMSPKSLKKIIAVTYTNRAADEIKDRLDLCGFKHPAIWAGTIHQFCSEFILRPYAMFIPRLSKGYQIIDEYVSNRYVEDILENLSLNLSYSERKKINLRLDRKLKVPPGRYQQVGEKYHKFLVDNREIDFDLILTLSYRILIDHPIAAQNLANVIRCLFIDEYQDTNELQYEIIGLLTQSNKTINAMFVGDIDQAIYGTLGGIARSIEEISEITSLTFEHETLTGCYRSTQRLVDFYSHFQQNPYKINSLAKHAEEAGVISLSNISKDQLYDYIADIIARRLNAGVKREDICVIAPQWVLLYPLNRELTRLLPNVAFDAPDISPIKPNDMSVFYKMARLIFTESGKNVSRRKRIATEIMGALFHDYGVNFAEDIDHLWILQRINTVRPSTNDGVEYFCEVVDQLFLSCGIKKLNYPSLYQNYGEFIDATRERTRRYSLCTSVSSFSRTFKSRDGVVITTCHKIKGEEYDTVIAFGVLHGMIPHWETVFNPSVSDAGEARKMLYVIASRAKTQLYLIAEQGRSTKGGSPYTITQVLGSYQFPYD